MSGYGTAEVQHTLTPQFFNVSLKASSITSESYRHSVEHIIISVWYQAVIFIMTTEFLPIMSQYYVPVYCWQMIGSF